MESGSQKILDIMEKVTTVEQNRDTIKWMAEQKMFSVVQMVIGMPGETPETIQESANMGCYFVEQSPEIDPNDLSINFAQALPGTPLYEYSQQIGVVGTSFGQYNGNFQKALFFLAKPFMRSSEKGAETSIYLCSSPDVSDVSGQYFYNCKIAKTTTWANNQEDADRLWDLSKGLTGII